jgi:hypothetical protein
MTNPTRDATPDAMKTCMFCGAVVPVVYITVDGDMTPYQQPGWVATVHNPGCEYVALVAILPSADGDAS